MYRIVLNEISRFGAGCRSVIADRVRKHGRHKAVLVNAKDLIRFGAAARVEEVLRKTDIPCGIYSRIKANPTIRNAEPPSRHEFRATARAMGIDTEGMRANEMVQAAIGAVKSLSLNIRIPQRLRETGGRERTSPQEPSQRSTTSARTATRVRCRLRRLLYRSAC